MRTATRGSPFAHVTSSTAAISRPPCYSHAIQHSFPPICSSEHDPDDFPGVLTDDAAAVEAHHDAAVRPDPGFSCAAGGQRPGHAFLAYPIDPNRYEFVVSEARTAKAGLHFFLRHPKVNLFDVPARHAGSRPHRNGEQYGSQSNAEEGHRKKPAPSGHGAFLSTPKLATLQNEGHAFARRTYVYTGNKPHPAR